METKKKIRKPVTEAVAKVPVVMQMEALECGAASLAMILAYYGKWLPLEQVRKECGVSRDGSNAGNVLKAARSYGLSASGYRYEPEMLKKEGVFPCIIHWNFNHFVVLKGFKGNRVYINDPARGSISVSMEEFDLSFTGVCLSFEPTQDFVQSGKRKSVLRFAAKCLKGSEIAVVYVALTTMIISFIGIIRAGFSRVFLDQLLTGNNLDWVTGFFVGIILLAIVQICVEWVNAICNLRINGKMAVNGNVLYMWKLMQLPMEFYSQRMAGDIQQRKDSNASVTARLVNTIAPLALNMIMMFFYLLVMVRYSLILTIVGVSAVLVNIILSRYISAKRVNISRVINRDRGKLVSATVSGIEMVETIKSSGAENGYFEKWAGYQASVNTQNVRYAKLNQYLGLIPSIAQQLANVIVLLMGIYLVMEGQFTIGMVMAFQGFLSAFTSPAQTLVGASQTIQEMRTDMERIEDVMEYQEQENAVEEKESTEEYSKLGGTVELKNITFGYSPLKEPLIQDFSMKLSQGARVAFVGSSGCGKSTLAKLISGLYKPWEGAILFEGKAISSIDHSVFTGSVAVVDQDIILFADTIANNIRMWDKTIEDYEVILAARDAKLHDDITLRDGGYQYKLNEGGTDLSGGQRQRLEIARVLAQDPTIIVLDEATSALDAKTEYEVVNAIKDRGITCIVIAHRLSTIRDCDEIIVLERGKVIERGKHEELMKKDGAYAKLVVSE